MSAEVERKPKKRKFACPICHDPQPFKFWQDSEPPDECPYEPSLRPGRDAMCAQQRQEAERAALWRKIAPDCFDERGNILPGKLGEVLERVYPSGGMIA
jgi:hypothetical protein